MFKHYLITALHYFARNKFTTTVNALCLAMGMACFAATYGVVAWFTNADRHYANADRIFFVTENLVPRGATFSTAPNPRTSWVTGSLARADLPQLPAIARLTPANEAPVSIPSGAAGSRNAFVATAFADPEFLEIFALPFLSGDSTGALKQPRSAVVTEEAARRIFGRTNVVGETVLFRNREQVTITGVVGKLKQPSHFGGGIALVTIEMLVSMDTYEAIVRANSSPTRIKEALGTWGANMGSFVYLLTPADGSVEPDTLNTWLQALATRHAPTGEGTFRLQALPIEKLYATFGDGIFSSLLTGVSSVAVLLALGGLILLISCINYANLATAQLTVRSKEVAMRRMVGAGRLEIVCQYLFETALLALIALALLLLLLIPVLGVMGSGAGIDLLGTVLFSSELWLMFAMTLAAVTLFAGAYPAVMLSRLRPLQALRGSQSAAGRRIIPTVLVGIQFGAAGFLLIAVLVMQTQNRELQRQQNSMTGDPVLAITTNLREAGVDPRVLRNELRHSEHVELVAAADEPPGGLQTGNHRFIGRTPDAASRLFVTTNAIDQDYFKALRMEVLAGRNFDTERGDEWNQNTARADQVMNVVINRMLAENAGWPDPNEAIGQTLYGLAGLGEHAITLRVVGVVETKPLALLGFFGSLATMYTLEPERASIPLVRLSKENTQQGVVALENVWKKLSPNVPLRRVFLDESFARSYRIIPVVNTTLAGMTLFAFFISAAGLIGMATHVTARRTREIGVRKTLGASVTRVLALLLRDFSKPVLIANVLVWPLAYIVMQGYLSMFMQRASLGATPFIAGLAITVGIACAAVATQATKAARLNPATVLRHE